MRINTTRGKDDVSMIVEPGQATAQTATAPDGRPIFAISKATWNPRQRRAKQGLRSLCAGLFCSLLLLSLAAVPAFATGPAFSVTPSIQTVAGNGIASYTGDGGAASAATVASPYAVAVDAAGNVYIADEGNHVIRRIDAATGKISTVAGTGTSGASGDGGPAASAELESPSGLAIDSAGNLYLADVAADTVREVVASTGDIKTIAGTAGFPGYSGDGGAATSARLNQPIGLAVDAAGNVYIADFNNNVVRKVTASNGKISTVAGNGTAGATGDSGLATSAELDLPRSVAIDRAGNLYIADEGNNRIRKVDATTNDISTVAGTGTASDTGNNSAATSATLNAPVAVALDRAGNLYIADMSGNYVREIYASNGVIVAVAGTGSSTDSGDGGAATAASLSMPDGLAVDNAGNLYVAEMGGNRVREVLTGQQFPSIAVGATISQNLLFTVNNTLTVNSIALPSGFSDYAVGSLTGTGCSIGSSISAGTVCTLAVTFQPKYPGERNDPLVISYNSGSSFTTGLSGVGTAPLLAFSPAEATTYAGSDAQGYSGDNGSATGAKLNQPTGLAMDAAGNLYIADQSNDVVRKVSSTGVITTIAGNGSAGFSGDGGTATSAMLNAPSRVAVDAAGNVYIADSANNRIREVSAATGDISTVAGNGTAGYSGDGGFATAAELYHPTGITVDREGNLFISDTNNNIVREVFAASGYIATIAGTGTAGAIGDGGAATSAELNHPAGLAVDSQGNIFIADDWNNAVREVNGFSGVITTIAGDGSSGYSGDGSAAISAELYGPEGVAVDPAGDVFIADENNERIREVNVSSGVISTVIGTGSLGYSSGGLSDGTSLASPSDVTLDSAGNLYVANPFTDTVAKLNITTAWRNFGYQAFKTSSSALSETLWNIGNSELDFSGQVIGIDSYSQAASGGTDCSATLAVAAGGSCAMQVVFTPQHASGLDSSVIFTDNSDNAAGTQQTLPLYGSSSKGSQTITFTSIGTQTYGVAPITLAATASSGLPVSFSVVSGPATVSGSTLSITGTGTVVVAASQSGDSDYYAASNVDQAITVNPAPLTVTADNQTRVFNTPNPTFTATYTGLVNGDTAASIGGAPTMTTTATTTSPAATYTISITKGTLNPTNYTLTLADGTLTITKATPTASWTVPSPITYGTALSSTQLDATGSVGGTFAYSPASGTVLTAGAHTLSATFTPADPVDYNGASSSTSLTVNKAQLTVTANDATRVYNTANPTFTDKITGLVNSDPASVVSGAATLGTTATTSSRVGIYPITVAAGTLSAANYTFSFTSGTLTITKATPTVTWNTPSAITYGTALSATQLNATASVPGSFSYSPALGTVLAAGTQTLSVTFTPTDSTDYSPVIQTVSLTVNKAVLTVTANDASRVAATANPTFSDTITGFVNGDTASVVSGASTFTTTATLSSPLGSYPITPALGTLSAANYTFQFVNGTLSVTKATPVITWTTPSAITYGTALSATQLDATANTAGNFSYSPALGTVLTAGAQTLSVTFTPSDTTTFNAATQTVTVSVDPAVLTVTAQDATRIYGAANPSFSAAITGFVNSDTSSVVTGAASFTTMATATSPVAAYPITPSQGTLSAANYTFAFANGALSVTQAGSSTAVAASSANVTYGQDVTLTATVTSSSGTPTGTVTFSDGSTTLGIGILNGSGVATLTATRPAGGSHSYTAMYAGDTNFTGSTSSAAAVTVSPVATTVTLQPSATAITSPADLVLGAEVSAPTGPPTGTVTFLDGTTVLGTQTLNGNGLASLSLTSPAVGTHSYAATYGGDNNDATATSPAVAVTVAPALAQANLSASSLTFKGQSITTTSAPQTVTLTNGGGRPLSITSVQATVDFTQTNTCGSTVGAGASCQISISFTPSATGARSGLIAITDAAGTQTIAVSGEGDELGLKLTPGSLTFGSQTLNAASTPQNFTLTNSSSSDIAIQSIAANGDYSQTNNCPATLTAGGSCDIAVTFTPTSTGDRTGSVTVTEAAGNISGSLDGQGASSAADSLQLLPATINFGTRNVGASGRPLVVTVKNITSSDFAINGISVTGDYSETNSCRSSLAAGATCRILLKFVPTMYGTRSGTLTIASNGSSEILGLTGVGSQGVITLSPDSLSFGSQQTGSTSPAQTVEVSNTGNAALTITSLSSSDNFTENDTCSGVTLQAGGRCSVNVTFTPQATGSPSGSIGINSTAGPAAIGVSGEGTAPGASLQPSALAFGAVAVDGSSSTQTVTLTNTGSAPMTIQSITADSDFAEQTDCPATLAAGARCIINVALSPTVTGVRSGNLLVQDDAGLQLVTLTGTGSNTGVLLTPTSLFFGSQAVGSTSDAQTVTVTNSGSTRLDISGIQLTGDFAQTTTCPSSLAPGSSCAISVTLDPTTQGTRTGTLTISDDAAGGSQTVSLSGDGIPAGVNLQPAQIIFGSVQVGQTSAAQTVVLTNQLSVPMNVVSITGTGDWNVTHTCGAQLAAGASCTLSITVTPTLPGAITGQINFDLQPVSSTTRRAGASAHAAPSNQPLVGYIAAQGQANPSGLEITPSAVNFGSQSVDTTSSAQTVTVTNNGQTDLAIQSITATSGFAQTNNCPATLTVGTACAIQVTFNPSVTGNVTGSLNLTDDLGAQSVVLSGTGIAAGITVSPTSLSFAATVVGSSSPVQTVTLSSSSGGAYALSGISASGDFSETNTCGSSLASGAICTISVTFTPAAGGNRTGSLTISGATPIIVPLSGTGNDAALNLSSTTFDFGNQLKGSASAAQTLTVTNSSNVPIAFTGVSASGDFSETTTCGSSIAPGSGCAVNVVFTPGATGSRTGTLTLTDGSPDSPQTVALTGTGTDLRLSATTPGESATIVAGQTATYGLTLTPSGYAGTVSLACSGGPALSSCTVNPQQISVSGSQPASVTVTVGTSASVNGAVPPPGGPESGQTGRELLMALTGLLLLLAFGRMRMPRRTWVLAGAMIVMALLLSACGTSDNLAKPSQSTSYTITVTATTASGATRAATLPLTVN